MNGIPKIIRQTYKSMNELPSEALSCIKSWRSLNPDWTLQFCSDEEMDEFFVGFQGGIYLSLYKNLPLPVMKADLWRYAIIYALGGFYSDIDTICKESLDEWLDIKGGLHIGCESELTFFCQWTFAAEPRHPAIKAVLNLIMRRIEMDGGVNEHRDHYVHYYTGPGVWTSAILGYTGGCHYPEMLLENKRLAAEAGIRVYPTAYFEGAKVSHCRGSIEWRHLQNYASWQAYRRDDANRIITATKGILGE